MQKDKIFNRIKRRSLFNIIPREISVQLLYECEVVSFSRNVIINSDQGVFNLFILTDGEVELYQDGNLKDRVISGRSIELNSLYEKRKKWNFVWQAKTDVTLLKIDFEKFKKIISVNQQLMTYLERMSTGPEFYKFKRDVKLLNIDDAIFQKIIINFTMFAASRSKLDEFLSVEGQRILIVIKTGSIRAVLGEGDSVKIVDEFFSSDYFFLTKYEEVSFIPSMDCSIWVEPFNYDKQIEYQDWALLDFLQEKINRIKREISVEQELERKEYDDAEPDDDRFEVSDFKPGESVLKKNYRKKFYWLQQHDMMDCGAACLTMISRFYGKRINLATWRSLVHITREGASMLSLKKAAERVGFDSIGVMSGYKALQELQVPMIALLQYHFVVIYKVDENFVVIADPGSQLTKVPKEDFLKEFSNNALLLKPNENLKKFPNSRSTFLKYLELFKGEKLKIFEIFAISIVIFVLGLALPLFMQFVFDNVLITQDEKFLRFVSLIFISLGLVNAISEWIRTVLVAKLTSKLDSKFTSLFLSHVLKLPFSYFAVRNVGDITTRLDEIGKIREFFSSKVVTTFLNIFGFVIYSSILFLYKVELIYVLIPFVIIFMLILHQIIKKVRKNLHDTFQAQGKNQSIVFEQMKSLETIKALGGEISARLRFEESLGRLLLLKKKFENIVNYLQSFSEFFQEIVSLSLFISSVYFYFKGELTLGQVMAVHALASSITTPLIQLMQDWDELNKIGISMEKVDEIITSKVEKIDLLKKEKDKNCFVQGAIHFKDVFFQYGNEHSPMILKKINLTIETNKVVAFVGGSGSGKTTLAYMINRLYSPTKGQIFVGDIDTDEVPLGSLRSNIAMISQENTLFAGTFLSNITLGDANADYEKAIACAKLANAHDFIMDKPGGYYYILGEGGMGISGGQKQRVNIARALYRDPNILIMDEATSALDAKSEKIIVDNLKQRSKNKTTIIIAHRLNTIMHADVIYVFDKGHLIESGSHKELISLQGKYYRMFKKQLEHR